MSPHPSQWYANLKVFGRWVGWMEDPHAFARPNLQIAIRPVPTAKRRKETVAAGTWIPRTVTISRGGAGPT
jgi:hypothetical protein